MIPPFLHFYTDFRFLQTLSSQVHGTPDPELVSGRHMGIDHGGLHAGVAEKLLDGPDVVSFLYII